MGKLDLVDDVIPSKLLKVVLVGSVLELEGLDFARVAGGRSTVDYNTGGSGGYGSAFDKLSTIHGGDND